MVKTVPRPGTQTPVATATLVAKKEGSHDDIVTGKPVAVAVAPPAPEVLPSPVASERPERPEILPRAVAESDHRQVADRIGDLLATRAPSRVLIRLEPADLGTILLDVRSFGGRNEATVTVSDDAVRQALAANRAELVQAIEARGLNLSQFSVSPDGSAAGQHRPDQTVMQDAVRTAQLAAANVRNDPAGPAAQLRPRLTAVDFMA
jgi:flagellar hook-length control protein FliK